MNACPCCSNPLLRHIQSGRVYWFCRTCWQEMPILDVVDSVTTVVHPIPLRVLDRRSSVSATTSPTSPRVGLTRYEPLAS